jgi:hypothetical protein
MGKGEKAVVGTGNQIMYPRKQLNVRILHKVRQRGIIDVESASWPPQHMWNGLNKWLKLRVIGQRFDCPQKGLDVALGAFW